MHTFEEVAAAYMSTPRFRGLAMNTKRIYMDGLVTLLATFETMPVEVMTRPMVLDFRDRHYDCPGKCKIALSTLNNVMKYAFDKGWISVNVAANVGDLPPSTPHKRWSMEEVRRFIDTAKPHLVTVVMVALYTGQRRSDLAKMRWADYDYEGRTISVKQKKTGKELVIPVHPALKLHLDTRAQHSGDNILLTSHGDRWQPDYMRAMVLAHCRRIGMQGRTIHGLRKTTASVLAEMGCTVLQIMAITGHTSVKEVMHYTEEVEQRKLANEAMQKWSTQDANAPD